MKVWDTATVAGRCAYHRNCEFLAGTRIVVVQGDGWRKTYCATAAKERFDMPADTGEVLDVTDRPNYPEGLKAVEEQPAVFDARMAAANDRADYDDSED